MRQALGRGIGALIPPVSGRSRPPDAETRVAAPDPSAVQEISVAAIAPNPRQPRERFDEDALADLAQSIATHGLLQPLLVRSLGEDRYELVAGERRLRAARLLGLERVPVLIRTASDNESLVLAIVENIQRADLSPLEEAHAFHDLVEEFSLTQEEVAARVGKSRSAVANSLRLLQLPEEIRAEIAAGKITAGHARALLSLDSDRARGALAREIVQRKLSVRDVERAALAARRSGPSQIADDPDLRRLESDLTRTLGTKVSIHLSARERRGAGHIEITFYSNDDLRRVADLLFGSNPRALARPAGA